MSWPFSFVARLALVWKYPSYFLHGRRNGFLVRRLKSPGDSEQREIKAFESVCGRLDGWGTSQIMELWTSRYNAQQQTCPSIIVVCTAILLLILSHYILCPTKEENVGFFLSGRLSCPTSDVFWNSIARTWTFLVKWPSASIFYVHIQVQRESHEMKFSLVTF